VMKRTNFIVSFAPRSERRRWVPIQMGLPYIFGSHIGITRGWLSLRCSLVNDISK
jgi:hypothetical protein